MLIDFEAHRHRRAAERRSIESLARQARLDRAASLIAAGLKVAGADGPSLAAAIARRIKSQSATAV